MVQGVLHKNKPDDIYIYKITEIWQNYQITKI